MKYVEIELPENFERGDCYNCPFCHSYSSFDEDDGWDYWDGCNLDYNEECKLQIKEK